jgi:hypothetical protein
MREMRARSDAGGFEFMPRLHDTYYRTLPDRIVGALLWGLVPLRWECGVCVLWV